MTRKKLLVIWLCTGIISSAIFTILWQQDNGTDYHQDTITSFILFFPIALCAVIGAIPTVIIFAYLYKATSWHLDYYTGNMLLSAITIGLIFITGYLPLRLLASVAVFFEKGTPYYDTHEQNFPKNLLYFVLSYSLPFLVGIWSEKNKD